MPEAAKLPGENDSRAAPWAASADDVLARLGSDAANGLGSVDASRRLDRYGRNKLPAARPRRLLSILVDQFRSIVVVLLLAAALLALAFGDLAEAVAICVVVVINSAIGYLTEWRAVRSMEALQSLSNVETAVIRDGIAAQVEATALVPGDIVLLDAGDVVTADLRIVEAAKLSANEATLTGESLPVSKNPGELAVDTPLAERANMLFKGTSIGRGTATAVVVATGVLTELGRISTLVREAKSHRTPLERRLDRLAHRLVWVVLAMSIVIAVIGILVGRETVLAIEVAIALAVAAIPEGLPIVATIALARGMWRMARSNALISRLSAVETLGATSVILSDKTGTLTESRMAVTSAHLPGRDIKLPAHDEPGLDELLRIAALCNNAAVAETADGDLSIVGDPTEVALLLAARDRGIDRRLLLEAMPEILELPFDPATKRMATLHADDGGVRVAVKGAPEAIVPMCRTLRRPEGSEVLDDGSQRRYIEHAQSIAESGLRTLALATKTMGRPDDDAWDGLELLGIVGLEDPLRPEVREAIQRCKSAGIGVVMVTGDHEATARHIAGELGIDEVHARVTPEEKLALISRYQQEGHVVAMTGDGVNDAPALKKADIGIAMGKRGTAVAREASSMVLVDDNFSTIVTAVAQGRAIFGNIRKFVVYLLACNTSEVLVVAIATLAGAPLPLLPLQILFLNLVTDVFPALALGLGEGPPSQMKNPPRPSSERILMGRHWVRIGLRGLLIALTVLGSMAIAMRVLGFDAAAAVTVSFGTLALAQVWHVFNMRDDDSPAFNNEITRNPFIWGAVVLCVVLVLVAVYVPALAEVLSLTDPGLDGWVLIVAASLLPALLSPLLPVRLARERG